MEGVPAPARTSLLPRVRPPLAPGWLATLATMALGVWTLWIVSVPGWNLRAQFVFVWWLFVIVLLLRLVGALVQRDYARQPQRVRWWGFAVVPAIVAATWLAVLYGLPVEARFALARGDMERDAKAILAGTKQPETLEHSGGYRILEAHVLRGRFVTLRTGVGAGFAYAPAGIPDHHCLRYTHLDGPWYTWSHPLLDVGCNGKGID